MKKIILASFCLMIAFTLSACGVKKEANNVNLGRRMPDFGQPEAVPSISGLVKSIIGNEVTILKIERSNRGQSGADSTATAGDKTDSTQEQKTTALTFGGAGTTGGAGRMGGGGGMARGGFTGDHSGATGGDNTAMIEAMKNMSTGEEKVIIPVGIQMLKRDTGTDAKTPTMIAATLEDIKQDTMLMIWLDESVSDRSIAKFVVIN